jgi:hypothetical protein
LTFFSSKSSFVNRLSYFHQREGVPPRGWAGRWASIQAGNKTPNQIPKQNSNQTRKQARNQSGNQARIQARREARKEAGEFTRGLAGKQPGIEAGRFTPEQAGITGT